MRKSLRVSKSSLETNIYFSQEIIKFRHNLYFVKKSQCSIWMPHDIGTFVCSVLGHYQALSLSALAAFFAFCSAFLAVADFPAFSCCLVNFGALPAAAASAFFWLLDLGMMICERIFQRPSSREMDAQLSLNALEM